MLVKFVYKFSKQLNVKSFNLRWHQQKKTSIHIEKEGAKNDIVL